MPGPYPAKGVANTFLNRGNADGVGIDPMKIQKLVYFAHGYYLATTSQPIIDELFEVWTHGPVLPSLYHEFKSFGYSAIKQLALDVDWEQDEFVPVPPPSGDPLAERCIEYVWKTYGRLPSTQLSRLTHSTDGPWARARSENTFNLKNKDIPNEYIKEYFTKFINKA